MLLLDTHVLLWTLDETDKLSLTARRAISQSRCCISIVSLWEMAVKASLVREERRLELDRSILDFAMLCQSYDIEILPVTPLDCEQVTKLANIHADPFDRMIIAQAMTRNIPLVTKDKNIWRYEGIEKIW